MTTVYIKIFFSSLPSPLIKINQESGKIVGIEHIVLFLVAQKNAPSFPRVPKKLLGIC